MILRLSDRLFENPQEEEQRQLRALFLMSEDESPPTLVVDGVDRQDTAFQRWAASLDDWMRQRVRYQVEWGDLCASMTAELVESEEHDALRWRRSGALDVRVERRDQSDWVALNLTLGDALGLATEPIHLRVENERNDYAFLRWLAKPDARHALDALFRRPGGLQVHGGGSGEIQVFLREHVTANRLTSDQLRCLWRTWILFDKDAGTVNAATYSSSCLELMDLCEQVKSKHGVPVNWVCLQRREIESYLPDSFLSGRHAARFGELPRSLQAWRRRKDRQTWAWSFDMKNGLLGDLSTAVSKRRREELYQGRGSPCAHELKAPFSDLTPGEIRDLSRGFGKSVLIDVLRDPEPPEWLFALGAEYDQGPPEQLSRDGLIQSIFDRS